MIVAAALATVWSAPGFAAESDAKAGAESQTKPSLKKTTAPARRVASGPTARSAPTQTRPWTIEDALPGHPSTLNTSAAAAKTSEFGKIKLQSGTLGLETENPTRARELPESRHIPALENTNTRVMPSYLGFSLSVPNSDKKLFPSPFGSSE